MRTFILLLLALTSIANAEGFTFLGEYVSHTRNSSSVTFKTSNNVLRLTVIGDATIRVQVGNGNAIRDEASYAVENELPAPGAWNIEELSDRLVMSLRQGSIVVTKKPMRLIFLSSSGGELLADDPAFGHGWDGHEVMVWKTLHDDDRFYGLGEKTGDVDKRGNQWVMWNTDFPAYAGNHDPLYVSVPFFIGANKSGNYGLFFDNPYRTEFNLGCGSKRVFSFGARDGEMNYYVFLGPSMKDIITQYTALTGRMPLPPLWALGYQQSRWNYYPAEELMDVARNFRRRRIPADVLYLDIRYMDKYKVFTWDTTAFPNPERMISELKDMGFKLVTIIDPGVKVEKGYSVDEEGTHNSYFARYADNTLYEGMVWPGWCHFPDFTNPAARGWWGGHYAKMFDQGVAGFWNDMNEPAVWGREMPATVVFDDDGINSSIRKIHNVYALLEARASYEGLLAHASRNRPFLLSRAGFAGIQKYSAVWTGDNVASFDHLELAIRMCLGLGLSGIPFVGSDVGGFIDHPTQELFVRWMQAGVFTPFLRSHSVINKRDQEPWSFGEEFEDNVRDCISLRYQLMPYIYTVFREASQTGVPMMRPMFLEYPDDTTCTHWEIRNQYMFGPDILVAPVVRASQEYQRVYLPAGRWLDPITEQMYDGGRFVVVEAPWWKLPYFFRAGSIIPRRETTQYADERPLTNLILDVTTGADGSSSLYLDDGKSLDYKKGVFDEIRFEQHKHGDTLFVSISSSGKKWVKAITQVTLRINNIAHEPKSVLLCGSALPKCGPQKLLATSKWNYNAKKLIVTINASSAPSNTILAVYP